ncbi:hypothetical protein FM21_34220 [Streptomyces mutabilis]|uniref:Uncharacterized protein n=1 Tax=Streptomyces mutabilis TaxID=67332 RepID=A0A086MR39_9ACTN|nr:hypothetical protein FM21_34220 [Streptomyces mutabilis]
MNASTTVTAQGLPERRFPHQSLGMRCPWVKDNASEFCGTWMEVAHGARLGCRSLPVGHPPGEDHRDRLMECMLGLSATRSGPAGS